MASSHVALRAPSAAAAPRNAGIDALRAALVMLVVLHHAAVTYGAAGSWFYREVRPSAAPSSLVLTVFAAVNQAYFMGLFFLIAGRFTPEAVARHGARGFLAERLKRLGLPLLAFLLVLGPLSHALAGLTQGRPFLGTLAAMAREVRLDPGPLWFLEALLIFSALFVLWRALDGGRLLGPAWPFPSQRLLLGAALATAATAFLLRLAWPVGTGVLGLQFGYFPSYVLLFVVGCLGAAADWPANIPPDRVRRWGWIALAAIPVLPLLLVARAWLPILRGNPAGGWTVPALAYALWEPFVAWGAILVLLAWFQRRFAVPSPLWRLLARRSFLVYIIHAPMLVAVAVAARGIPAPPLLKFAVVGPLAIVLCVLTAGRLLRVRAIAAIV
jgi:peptidoglycan/LPS O-acetylase OafA/YrhL